MALVSACVAVGASAQTVSPANEIIVQARAAWAKKDAATLAALRDEAINNRHPLAQWVDYWELNGRLALATQDELSAFYARWPNTYVEDRLRNDWLLELGKRRDLATLARELPRYRMQDDKEVACWALLVRHANGGDVSPAEARSTWLAQRDGDDGCQAMATDLFAARKLTVADAWRKARIATEAGRQRVARHAASLVGDDAGAAVGEVFQSPGRYLAKKGGTGSRSQTELTALALIRLASSDVDMAAAQMSERWAQSLPAPTTAWVWASIGKQAAMKLLPQADDHFQNADTAARGKADAEPWPDDTLAWKARAALRANEGQGRWQQVMQAINGMSPEQQRDATWVYWKARALKALAADSQEGVALIAESHALMGSIAPQLNFYGKLAAEDLGRPFSLPAKPAPLTSEERKAVAGEQGLWRALELIQAGVRTEGVREWNYTVGWGKPGGWSDRELRAIAQLACERQVWDRCINTSEKTQTEVDIDQRYPLPFRTEVVRTAGEVGLDAAYVYGLIRQESRFITDARSGVGAAGLMQVMPATARWTARKLGIPYNGQITDRDTNLKLGTGYLKLLVDDFGGSQPMATAGYNAGPNRPRRWREGPLLDPAAWAENIPFSETRDYVKKVLSNATVYSAVLTGRAQSLKARLGAAVGPLPPTAPPVDNSLP